VARNEFRMSGAVRQIVHILYILAPYLSLQLIHTSAVEVYHFR